MASQFLFLIAIYCLSISPLSYENILESSIYAIEGK
jgi:hypothetical protein